MKRPEPVAAVGKQGCRATQQETKKRTAVTDRRGRRSLQRTEIIAVGDTFILHYALCILHLFYQHGCHKGLLEKFHEADTLDQKRIVNIIVTTVGTLRIAHALGKDHIGPVKSRLGFG